MWCRYSVCVERILYPTGTAPGEATVSPAQAAAYAETLGATEEIGRLQQALGFEGVGPPAVGAVTPGQ